MQGNVDTRLFDLFEFRPSKGDLKRMEIILAAIECLHTIGFEKTTYEAIAKVVGTRRAHINYYFKDKQDIFLDCVKYIVANYQQTSIDHIEKATDARSMLEHYIEAPFIWARKNPEQLSVMLLFYYLCHIKDEYRDLHHQIRRGGVERMHYILSEKLGYEESASRFMSKSIQNHISGAMMDAGTTKGRSMKAAEDDVKLWVDMLLKNQREKK